MRAVGAWARSIPFTWVIAGVAVVVGVLQVLFHASLAKLFDNMLSLSFDSVVSQHHWFASLTSVLFAPRALNILVVVPIILIVLGTAERLMGTWRAVLAYVVVAVLGGTLGLALQGAALWLNIGVAQQVRGHSTIDPLIPIVGTIMVASAFATPLLRRRIRVIGFAALLMFVLYSGQPSDLYRTLSAVVGVFLGVLMQHLRARRLLARSPDAPQTAPFAPRRAAGDRGSGRASRVLRRSSHREQRSLLAAIVAITAVGPLITIIAPNGFGPLQPLGLLFSQTLMTNQGIRQSIAGANGLVPFCEVTSYSDACADAFALSRLDGLGPVLVTLLPLVVLLIAALGVVRGRRVALWLAVAVNVFLSILGIIYYGVFPAVGANSFFDLSNGQFDQYSVSVIISVAVPLMVAALLLVNLRILPRETRAGAVWSFFMTVAVAFVVISAIYLVIAFAMRAQFSPVVSFTDLLADLPERFMPVGFLSLERVDVFPLGGGAQFVYEWVGPLFWFVVCVAAILSISHITLGSTVSQGARIRSLLYEGASGSLSWMTTWSGHQYWFSEHSTAAVAYRVINGVAIATGEPLGAPDDRVPAIAEFAEFCTNHGWTPVFYAVSGTLQPVFDELHWSMMQIAEEAVIDVATFSLEGKKMQDVRTSINKAVKLGVRAEFTSYARLSAAHVNQIREISEGWVAEKNLPEMGFTLGGIDELTDPDVRLMLAIDADENVLGVTSWLPTYRRGVVVGYSLDFMRRGSNTMNGVMEFTLAESIRAAREQGLEFISLSAAPLAQSESQRPGGEGSAAVVLGILGRALEPVYGFQSLLAFKQKFRPERVPLYLAYGDPLSLPAVGVSLARAYVPTFSARHAIGFLTRG
ncbi:DUF2156 domain-containing protein [Subtercola vilae]|uniref:DUF2156 domain-containing protein n=1 Tax=Subtercola vilae TaxID=2056433 RepID=A0A4T2C709_9MICO|nr:DUF2156 domain-containing protein [Subtercola vilae]